MLIRKVDKRIDQYLKILDEKKYRKIADLEYEVADTLKTYRTIPEDLEWTKGEIPIQYGKEWASFWFRTEFILPEEERGKEIFLQGELHTDSLVFINGIPSGSLNLHHSRIRLSDKGEAGSPYNIYIEAYGGHKFPGLGPNEKESVFLTIGYTIPDYPNVFSSSGIYVKEKEIYKLYYDVQTLLELAENLNENSLRKNKILQGLYLNLIKIEFDSDNEKLSGQIEKASREIARLLEKTASETMPRINAIGHAHIDHAWLWPIAETEKKVARTFANMCRYAEEFEEFVFLQSQPCQLEIVKNEYPEIFENIKKTYKKGQWDPNGGMWVEADCNVTGGESLIRQFLIGKKTSRELLDYEGDTLWLPDVFGYSGALPQILIGCEIEYFITSKINWNDTTRFPYDTFLWRGIDGTGVKTTYITDCHGGYNGSLNPANVFESWNNVQHKEIQSAIVKSIGEGDGGGGTHRSDLEFARRLKNLEGSPRVRWKKLSDGVADVFSDILELPEWMGELYLELHRGTYTSQAKTKRYNRKLEFALQENEAFAAMTTPSLYPLLCSKGNGESERDYPSEILLKSWKTILTNQFHDIIPGSSIGKVYKDAEREYTIAETALRELKEETLSLLGGCLRPAFDGRFLAFFNSLSWKRQSKTVLPEGDDICDRTILVKGDRTFPVQRDTDLDGRNLWIAIPEVPSLGGALYQLKTEKEQPESPFIYERDTLKTPFYKVQFDPMGRIISLKRTNHWKEFVKEGEALNTILSAEDIPVYWDAWDIDEDYNYKIIKEENLLSLEVISRGPLFIKFRSRYSIGKKSELLQDTIFYRDIERIDFETKVEWHEDHRLLKASFPVNIVSSKVKCEIQYGHVERNTSENLMSDRSQFEVCAHKWISIDDSANGIALMNDCKYGHDIKGGTMRITLLKSPKAPDAEADMGTHYFTYSLLPYRGAFSSEKVVKPAYDLNQNISILQMKSWHSNDEGIDEFSLLSLSNGNIIIESLKKAEEGESLIIRLYESGGSEEKTSVKFSIPPVKAGEVNMMERMEKDLNAHGKELTLSFRPFEIKTIKVSFS